MLLGFLDGNNIGRRIFLFVISSFSVRVYFFISSDKLVKGVLVFYCHVG